MTIWRMAMRCGSQGPSMFEECRALNIAAITYEVIQDIDLSEYSPDRLPKNWKYMSSAQKSSLHKLAFEMKQGDIIFVKDGGRIIARGVISGPYSFRRNALIDLDGCRWSHTVPVKWDTEEEFTPVEIRVGNQLLTIQKLKGEDLAQLEAAIKAYPGQYAVYEEEQVITQRCKGQGYGLNAAERHIVEMHAMDAAKKYFEKEGYAWQDTSAKKPYDLVCTKNGQEWYVEVKGTTGQADTVFLTKNEVQHAQDHPTCTILFIYSDIKLDKEEQSPFGGKERLMKPWCPKEEDLESLEYRYTLPPK